MKPKLTRIMSSKMKKIIIEIYQDPKYYDCCKNIAQSEGTKQNLIDDLFQECMIILCESPESKIFDLYKKRQLRFYFAGIVINQWHSSKKNAYSPFYKKYRKERKEKITDNVGVKGSLEGRRIDPFTFVDTYIVPEIDTQYNDEDKLISKIKKALESFYWKDKEIFLIYVENNHTLTSLSKELGLSRNTVNDSIQRTKAYLSKELNIPRTKKNIF